MNSKLVLGKRGKVKGEGENTTPFPLYLYPFPDLQQIQCL
ncbi:hypothetical protein FDUTEX481_09051 [Tolypothrix sp. PCC 7601]|nr:hypothetical protein FDUTEX481_09051 [Tolypothrix sp. PCC 7601]